MTQPGSPGSAEAPTDGYEEWLDRLRSTYESISFSCVHRLGDRALADRVAAQVVAGLLRKPSVFRFFGLPYSARIGHLAEDHIAAAKAGDRNQTADWARILRNLRALPQLTRTVFVLSCVHGLDAAQIATHLGLTDDAAHDAVADALAQMRAIGDQELHTPEAGPPSAIE